MEVAKNKISHLGHHTSDIGLKDFIENSENRSLKDSIDQFDNFILNLKKNNEHSFFRIITSAPGRHVYEKNEVNSKTERKLMFGSNNYLGFGNNPYINKKVKHVIDLYGTGVGGPALLNGYSKSMNELEKRIARFKHQEDCMIFSAGYNANLGFVSALIEKDDLVLYDELSHASLIDALRLKQAMSVKFKHNDCEDLEQLLALHTRKIKGCIWVCMEGVYSMDGDLSPLPDLIPIIKKYNAFSMLDDAHGTGVLGKNGSGTAEHFELSDKIDISMGTFSKTFAVTGGFLAANKKLIQYMRYFARPYMFSASLPPMTLAAVNAGLDIIEQEPLLREKLHKNISYASELLKAFHVFQKSESAIISIIVPKWMNIRKANSLIDQQGIFLNAIEYPAVPKEMQRFRISLMAQHCKKDIEFLATTLKLVYADHKVRY